MELKRRLETWWGGSLPPLSRFSDKPPRKLPVALTADPEELPIVRALAAGDRLPTFGVTSAGAVFTTDDGAWHADSRAVFITGLSPLLDELTDIFHHATGDEGGRFYDSQSASLQIGTSRAGGPPGMASPLHHAV